MIQAIVGANWGDEGKGKMTDVLAGGADVVVRYQGGSNAGHTIINPQGKFALHQLPSGIFNPNVVNVIANGVALDIAKLATEIEAVRSAGVEFILKVSDRAQVLLPYHVLLDVYEEERLGDRKFGSTKSGIAPFYADKFSKVGLQLWQLFDDPDLPRRVQGICEKVSITMRHLYGKPALDADELLTTLQGYADIIRPYVDDTALLLSQAAKQGKNILLEGQLGALRDPDHGIYPYVTSSSTLAGYAPVGAGLPPQSIAEVVAVTKAYSSCVGEGPFTTELFGDEAENLRRRGGDAGEYGATTGRPRRVGHFDAVATRYGCRLQGATAVAVTGLDVLEYLPEIPVCVAYEIDGATTDSFPTTARLWRAKPVYETLPGWQGHNIRGISDYDALPEQAKEYVRFIEQQIGTPIRYISTGPERESLIVRT